MLLLYFLITRSEEVFKLENKFFFLFDDWVGVESFFSTGFYRMVSNRFPSKIAMLVRVLMCLAMYL